MSRKSQKAPDRESYSFHLGELVDDLTYKYGLTQSMRVFFFHRLRYSTDSDAARAASISLETLKSWKRDERRNLGRAKFMSAYNEFFARYVESIEKDMEALAGKAIRATDELLEAKTLTVTKDGVIESPDYESRYKGIQALAHWLGRWGTGTKIEIGAGASVVEEGFRQLMEKKLRELPSGIIEGEAKEVS